MSCSAVMPPPAPSVPEVPEVPAAPPQRPPATQSPDAFSRQLRAPGYVLDVRPDRPPPARRREAGPLEKGAGGVPVPCVVLLSRSCDAELTAVAGLLGKAG